MLAHALRESFEEIYQLAYRLTLREEDRAALLREAVVIALEQLPALQASGGNGSPGPEDARGLLLRGVAEAVQSRQRQRPQLTFDDLDAQIRNDPTNPDALRGIGDAEREQLLWDLKEGCLTAAVTCLPPGERVAFALLDVLGCDPEATAAALGIRTSALRVRASRARNKIVDYLSPRCGHVNARNPCQCPSRLGVAFEHGFVGPVAGRRALLRDFPAFGEQGPTHEPLSVYRRLPSPKPPAELLEELLALI